ncbi:MAG: DUF1499 domain-containing protein [Halioglobus sp.]
MKILRLCIPLLMIFLFACTSAPKKPDADASLPPCGAFPNCVNSHSGKGGSAIEPLLATVQQWQAFKRWLATQDNWTIEVEQADFVQAVVKTPLMRFRDDVQLQYSPQTGVIQVRSSSRLGIGDMGANRDRVESLRARLAGQATASAP